MSQKKPVKKRPPTPHSIQDFAQNRENLVHFLEDIPWDKQAQFLADLVKRCENRVETLFKDGIDIIDLLHNIKSIDFKEYVRIATKNRIKTGDDTFTLDPKTLKKIPPEKPEKLDRIYHHMFHEDPNCAKFMNRVIAARARSQCYGKNRCRTEEEINNILIRISQAMAQGKWQGPLNINQHKVRTDPDELQRLAVFLMDAESPVIMDDEKFEQFLRRKEKRERRVLGKLQQTM